MQITNRDYKLDLYAAGKLKSILVRKSQVKFRNSSVLGSKEFWLTVAEIDKDTIESTFTNPINGTSIKIYSSLSFSPTGKVISDTPSDWFSADIACYLNDTTCHKKYLYIPLYTYSTRVLKKDHYVKYI